jgi:hypothetical protein
MIYLPIDKLLEKSAAAAEGSEPQVVGPARDQPQESVTIEARGRGER